jgi:ribosomal protein L11 methyltransferase
MHTVRLRCRPGEKDFAIAALYDLATLGIRETEVLGENLVEFEAWFEAPVEAPALDAYGAMWERAPEIDWVARSREGWEPPDWRDDPAPEGRLRLPAHAGNASGSGYSEPTQLALEALEKHLHPGETVFDVGTGSGILTAAAALLGAGRSIACDIDPDAARTAAANLRVDGADAVVFAGSPRALRAGIASLAIANVNAVALLAMATDLARVLTSDGRLIVSGFRERRLRDIRRAFELRGLIVRDQLANGDWRALVLCAVP